MLHKSFDIIETKAEGDSGEFTALVSTFGNVDKVGDRIVNGAYANTLAKWRKSGDPLPIILAHQWDDVMAHVGYAKAENIRETPRGLVVTGTLDVEDNPVARQVHKLMKRRTLKEFSIGYSVPAGGEHRAKDGANEITEIELAECGPCLKGIDPKTELREVKSALGVEDPPKDPETLQREATRVARELEAERLPVVPPAAEVKAEPGVDVEAELEKVKAQLAEVLERLKAPPIDPVTLRKEADRAAREVEQNQIPDVPGPPKAPDADLVKELQEVKAQLAETRQLVEDLKSKADVTDKEPSARSVDPLRKQAETVALEIASGGQSLRKPPKTVEAPQPELMPLGELKKRMRDEMLGVLSGGTTE